MESDSNRLQANPAAKGKVTSLDYFFTQNEQIETYQLVRFSEAIAWLVLQDGVLLSTIIVQNGEWSEIGVKILAHHRLQDIGAFINKQHFNFLPGRIKQRWSVAIQQVITQSDSSYLIICKPGIEFNRFSNIFSSYISELVDDQWTVEFKVYNSDFTDEFMVKIL